MDEEHNDWHDSTVTSALFRIKLLHTLIFIVESAAILYILYSGLFNVRGLGLVIAVIVVLAEVVVFVANGTHCPLTKLARRLATRLAMISSQTSFAGALRAVDSVRMWWVSVDRPADSWGTVVDRVGCFPNSSCQVSRNNT